MKNRIKIVVSLLLVFICVVACVSCNAKAMNRTQHSDAESTRVILDGSDESEVVATADTIEDIENSYRLRFLYSYTAILGNDAGRLEKRTKTVTVKSFYIPKDNPVITKEIKNQIAGLTYRGFSFEGCYKEWDKETQTGVAGTEFDYNSLSSISGDVDIYCSRGDLAGVNAHWSLVETSKKEVEDENGKVSIEYEYTLNINGSGPMFDAVAANELDLPWYTEHKSITKVVIGDGITHIGNNSFSGLENLKQIELPDSIASIGEGAFQKTAIRKFIAPAELKVIKKNAFNTTGLIEVVLNNKIEVLESRAFYGSKSIKTIVVPGTLKTIGLGAFHPGMTGNGGTAGHALSQIYYYNVDSNGNAKEATVDDFKKINIGLDNSWFNEKATVFYYSPQLKIGNYWHFDVDGKTPLQYCFAMNYIYRNKPTPIKTIYVPATPKRDTSGNLVLDSAGYPILEGTITEDHLNQHRNIVYHNMTFSDLATKLSIGKVITSDQEFECKLTDALSHDGGIIGSISDTVLKISVKNRDEIKAKIDNDVDTRSKEKGGLVLTDIELDVYAKYVASKSGATKTYKQITDELIAAGRKLSTTQQLSDLKAARLAAAYSMWDFVELSEAVSFWAKKGSLASITQIIIEDGVEYIGRYTFSNVSKVKDIVLPATLKDINTDAFLGCTSLVTVYYSGTISDTACPSLKDWNHSRITAYSKVDSATSAKGNYWIVLGNEGKKLAWSFKGDEILVGGDDVMYNFKSASEVPWYGARGSIASAKFASNIISIGTHVFEGYVNLSSLTIPTSTRIIPASAFAGSFIMTEVDGDFSKYKNGMLIVNGHLLKVTEDCNKLIFETNVNINNIADGAFDGCTNIERIYIARTIQHINPDAFKDCNLQYIFADIPEAAWVIAAGNTDLGDASVYFKKSGPPREMIKDPSGKNHSVIVDNKYWTKCGKEYVIWGCTHVYGEYNESDKNGTCQTNATQSAFCQIEGCGSFISKPIPNSTTNVHDFINDDGTESTTCVVPGCTAVKKEEE